MAARNADLIGVTAAAALITLVLAASAVSAPAQRIFGQASVGWHHDPFTWMQQIDRPTQLGTYSQPVTDLIGTAMARVLGPVAAYNIVVLISFPLSAAAGFLLARQFACSRAGSAVAALAFAFSPFHIAHAAYHPHIAQTHWLALYLLALWRSLDSPSAAALACLGAATAAVTLSNFYGGFIAATVTPMAVIVYWLAIRRPRGAPLGGLLVTTAALAAIAAGGLAYALVVAKVDLVNPSAFAARRSDLLLYSATWWSYLTPPVANPLLGDTARHVWAQAGVRDGLLEQQVYLGWGVVALAAVAAASWARTERRAPALAAVPVFIAVAAVAFACSLSPQDAVGSSIARPSALLFDVAPMFRSYARFGVIVQLMAALLAGLGVDRLVRLRTRWATAAAVTLVALIVAEYAVSPWAASRDVLPTEAHRLFADHGPNARLLDCAPPGVDASTVSWLSGGRVSTLNGTIDDCDEPEIAGKLTAQGFTHMLFRDGRLAALPKAPPPVHTESVTGFWPRERDTDWSWRWMESDATWSVVNATSRPVAATLHLEVSSFARDRRVTLLLDGQAEPSILVSPERRTFEVGPFTVPPGAHELTFRPAGPPSIADEVIHNRDHRALTIAIGTWRWQVDSELP